MIKNVATSIAIFLAFFAYIPYINDIVRGKTKPHIFSWFVWGILALMIFALQLKGGAGAGAYVTLTAALITLLVFVLGLREGKKDITKWDLVFLSLALLSLFIWLFAKQPIISTILLVVIDMLGFMPTIRKSWLRPSEETLSTWAINALRYGIAIVALSKYNVLTLLYPVAWLIANVSISIMLFYRRKALA